MLYCAGCCLWKEAGWILSRFWRHSQRWNWKEKERKRVESRERELGSLGWVLDFYSSLLESACSVRSFFFFFFLVIARSIFLVIERSFFFFLVIARSFFLVIARSLFFFLVIVRGFGLLGHSKDFLPRNGGKRVVGHSLCVHTALRGMPRTVSSVTVAGEL